MTRKIKPNVEKKKKVEALHSAILQAKKDFARAWVTLASNLNNLKLQMGGDKDRKFNWQTFVGVDSFEEYCDEVLDLDSKTGYQLISSLDVLKDYKPELLENTDLAAPAWTKVRLLSTKKSKALLESHPGDHQQIVTKVFDDKISRRKLESDFEYYIDKHSDETTPREVDVDPAVLKLTSYINNHKNDLVECIKSGDWTKFNKIIGGIPGMYNFSTRVEKTNIRRIVVTNSAKDSDYAKQVVSHSLKLDPSIEIIYTGVTKNGKDILRFPSQLQGAGNYWWMKETLYISERKTTPFIETFPSPGDIVEKPTTVLKLGFHCKSICQYCYLQKTKPSNQLAYSNLESIKQELRLESYVHKCTLTLWSVISHIQKRSYAKLPENLHTESDELRLKLHKLTEIDDSIIIQLLANEAKSIIDRLEIDYNPDELNSVVSDIQKLYQENLKFPLVVLVSEYSDILAIESIAGQMEYIFTDLLPEYTEVNFQVNTKTAYKDCFLKFDGQNRVIVKVSLNPKIVIDKYEKGTSNLEERLDFIKSLQEKGGYLIRIGVEPMLIFDDWQKAYKELVDIVASSIDLDSVMNITLGSLRLRRGLKTEIIRNYPWTDLFNEVEIFDKPYREDKRERYTEKIRVEQYRLMIDELSKRTNTDIILGAEYPEMWDWVGLDKEKFMKSKVYQYNRKEKSEK